MSFTHFNESGRARMVDVSEKALSKRVARAMAEITMPAATLQQILQGEVSKGDVLAVAQVAGIMAAKQTASIIPMCHPIPISAVDLDFEICTEESRITLFATVSSSGQTGVEMEALTACSVAALTIYDMCKAMGQGMTISNICLLAKSGGKSGDYKRSVQDA